MTNLDKVIIKYKGGGFLPDVPTRDMTYDEAQEFDISELLNSGLYVIEEPPKPKRTYKKSEPDEEQENPADDGEKEGE